MLYSLVSELLFVTNFPVVAEVVLIIILSAGQLTRRGFI